MMKKILSVFSVVLVVAALGAAYWFWLKPKGNIPQTAAVTPDNIPAYRDYKDDDVSLKYPAWADLAGRYAIPENAKIAVSNGSNCTFVLNKHEVPQNQTLQAFIDDLVAKSGKDKIVTVTKKEVAGNSVVVQEDIVNQGVAIFSSAQGRLDKNRNLFAANFMGLKSDFDQECAPYMKTVFDSIKLAH